MVHYDSWTCSLLGNGLQATVELEAKDIYGTGSFPIVVSYWLRRFGALPSHSPDGIHPYDLRPCQATVLMGFNHMT